MGEGGAPQVRAWMRERSRGSGLVKGGCRGYPNNVLARDFQLLDDPVEAAHTHEARHGPADPAHGHKQGLAFGVPTKTRRKSVGVEM